MEYRYYIFFLRECYKPSAFLRDVVKMDSVKSLVNFTVACIDFDM